MTMATTFTNIFSTINKIENILNFIKESYSLEQKVYALCKSKYGYNSRIVISKENELPILLASKNKPTNGWLLKHFGEHLADDTCFNELRVIEVSTKHSLERVLQSIIGIKTNEYNGVSSNY